jgi:hypothetical protein
MYSPTDGLQIAWTTASMEGEMKLNNEDSPQIAHSLAANRMRRHRRRRRKGLRSIMI